MKKEDKEVKDSIVIRRRKRDNAVWLKRQSCYWEIGGWRKSWWRQEGGGWQIEGRRVLTEGQTYGGFWRGRARGRKSGGNRVAVFVPCTYIFRSFNLSLYLCTKPKTQNVQCLVNCLSDYFFLKACIFNPLPHFQISTKEWQQQICCLLQHCHHIKPVLESLGQILSLCAQAVTANGCMTK